MKTAADHILSKWPYLPVLSVLLYALSFVFDTTITDNSSVERETDKLESYIHHYQADFSRFLKDTVLLQQLSQGKESLATLETVANKKYGIYLFVKDQESVTKMLFWSNQNIVPPDRFHSLPDGEYMEHLSNGYYLCDKRTVSLSSVPQKLVAYALFPVLNVYFVETDYLPVEFATGTQTGKRIVISPVPTNYPVKSVSGLPLFYVDKKNNSPVAQNTGIIIWLRSFSLGLMLLFIYLVSERVAVKKRIWLGVGVLAGSLLLLRITCYFLPFPFNLRQFELFDPSVFGTDRINKSLGDLLINSVIFWWIAVFTWSKLGDKEVSDTWNKTWVRYSTGIFSLILFVFFSFFMTNLIRGLVADSKISFNVTDFFSLNRYSVIGFVCLAAISLGYYYFSKILFRYINLLFRNLPFLLYLSIGFTGLVYLTFNFGDPLTRFYLLVLLWVLVYAWLLNSHSFLINRFQATVAGVLFWIFIFSFSLSLIIINENKNKEWDTRKEFAERLSVQSDPTTERQLSIALTYVDNDFLLQNFHRFYNESDNLFLRDSILRSSGYLNKYDTRLFVYDNTGLGLFNADAESFNTLNTIFTVQAKPTNTPGFFYYETSYDRFTYIIKREVKNTDGDRKGYVFVVANPKQYGSDALYPELFRQKNFDDPANYPVYSYAVYKNRNLVNKPFNKYPFATSLTDRDIPREEFQKVENGNYDELWYRASAEKILVVTRKQDSVLEAITLFSYIFCAFLFMVSILRLISILIRAVYKRNELRRMMQMNIRSQVHSVVILISLISFVVIGIATIRFFYSRFERTNTDRLSRTMSVMVNEMQKRLADHQTFDDVIKMYDSVSNNDIQNLVEEVAEIHNVDVNVYDLTGNLAVSSQPLVYQEGFLSIKIHPVAFYHLSRLRQIQHVQEEAMGNLSYKSIYAPVRDGDGNVDAYLNIPYFLSQRELNQEISNFLVTLINLNAFIFLIAGAIALVITNRITRSFSFISEKMKEVNLGKTNEVIEWNRDDEIGGLVKEYNKMVKKLEESASALAKSEREGAWREMARQVAHEIKNPLTPMKLSIQYLQKAINNNAGNVKELSANVAKTLIEQIDHLSKIAADFSQFANIGNLTIEEFDLHEVIGSLKDLYKSNNRVEIVWYPVPEKLMVKSDKTQMNRLFTNLFQNAVEASESRHISLIEVGEFKSNGTIRISVRDNGEGVPEEMKAKIFAPNFTTKSSGTGLGLAMCKSIVEQVNGNIWFETEQGRGSVFYVELPSDA